jgi:hypothetical protein
MNGKVPVSPVASAVRTLKVLTAVGFLNHLVILLFSPQFQGLMSQATSGDGEDATIVLVGTLLGIAINFSHYPIVWFLLNRVARRRNWARITVLILTIGGVPLMLLQWIRGFSTAPLQTLFSVLLGVYSWITTLTLFSDASSAWFKSADDVSAKQDA